jgi:hypothetical protein
VLHGASSSSNNNNSDALQLVKKPLGGWRETPAAAGGFKENVVLEAAKVMPGGVAVNGDGRGGGGEGGGGGDGGGATTACNAGYKAPRASAPHPSSGGGVLESDEIQRLRTQVNTLWVKARQEEELRVQATHETGHVWAVLELAEAQRKQEEKEHGAVMASLRGRVGQLEVRPTILCLHMRHHPVVKTQTRFQG